MPRTRRISRGKLRAEVLSNGFIVNGSNGNSAIIASARNLTIKTIPTKKIKTQAWQEAAWNFYDIIEVYHYAVQWVGNMLSRATLYPTLDGDPTDDPRAVAALDAFFGGKSNHGEFLRQSGIHFTVAGEGYVVGTEMDGSEEWEVVSAVEVKATAGDWYRVYGEDLPENAFIMRMWRPHPRKSLISDSPTRPLIPVLSLLDELTKYTSAQMDSRLASAGIFPIPSETELPSQATNESGDTQTTVAQSLMREIAETASLTKTERGTAASVTPIVISMPGEFIDKLQHITFWSELDEHASEKEDKLIHRLALGLDMPPEALEGTGDMNHWGAWQVDESLIKSHSEPLLELITASVAEQYLQVILEADGMTEEEAARFGVGADASELALRPNRSKESLELGDRLLLSDAAQRRENGFDESDAPSEEEIKRSLLLKLAQGSPSPETVQAAIEALGIDLNIPKDAPTGNEERPAPRSLREHPSRELPEVAAVLMAVAESAVFRALERCGNKLKSSMSQISGLPTGLRAVDRYQFVTLSKNSLDNLLDGAWDTLDLIALPGGIDRDEFETHLDNYTRMLISSRQPYDRNVLETYVGLIWKAEP